MFFVSLSKAYINKLGNDAGRGLQPRSKRLDASIAFETLSLQPRLKRLILQLSLKDHRRNMPAFGYIAPFGCI